LTPLYFGAVISIVERSFGFEKCGTSGIRLVPAETDLSSGAIDVSKAEQLTETEQESHW
jgi:hypothetical protein